MTTPTRHESAPAFTGSRGDFAALADDLVEAAWRHASPTGSLLRLPGPQSASGAWSDGLEGFARTFLAAAFRAANGDDPRDHLARYADGLRAGVDPDHPERWPRFDERRQAIPEAASIAIALHETRPLVWDELSDRTQQQIIEWLRGVVGRTDFHSNWLWFQNVIEAFLDSVGAETDARDRERNARTAEALYVRDGWHSDGRGRDGERQSFDWYAGWAWHVYPLLEARIRGRTLGDEQRAQLAAYLDQARDLIGSRGEPVLVGRSAAYRFAVVAPFWAGAIADATPLEAGETRHLAARTVRSFLEAEAVDERGLLPIGWHGAFPPVRQLYTGGSSPYWASKAFLGLLLPGTHPEWGASPDPTPRAVTRLHAGPGWIVSATPDDGIVRLYNHGSDRMHEARHTPHADDPFYRRVAYSNVTSPQLGADAVSDPRDANATLLDDAGRAAHRDAIKRVFHHDRVAVSRSRVHWLGGDTIDDAGFVGMRLGPILTVASIVDGAAEVRLAWWRNAPQATGRAASAVELDADAAWPRDPGPWRVSFGGWAIADPVLARPGEASSARAVSRIRPLRGVDRVDQVERTGTDPFGEVSITPIATSTLPLPEATLAAALIELAGADRDPAPSAARRAAPRIELADGAIHVSWDDGSVDVVPTDGPLS